METDTPRTDEGAASRVWARTFATVYEPFLWTGEQLGLRNHRRELLRQAAGRTVEIGAGTGLNLPHYPPSLDELILIEPDAAMRRRLARRVVRDGRRARVVDAPAEQLPFADGSIDTVVSTFVLCTVEDPGRALREIRRVLKPEGQLLVIEHVRSASPRLAGWQDRLATPWRRFARGCRCNRPTAALMQDAGLDVAGLHDGSWPAMPPIVRPLLSGRAHPTAPPGTRAVSSPDDAIVVGPQERWIDR